ncbi:MAG TPA: hypothetical protein VF625_01245 [Longimicrobium sp.]
MDRPFGNDAVHIRFAGEDESDGSEEAEIHHHALERHALVVERRGVCLIVIVVGFTLVKLGALIVHGGGVVVRAREMSVVRERVQHGHAGRDEIRDQRKAGDEEPPTERARMHRHAPNLARAERMRQPTPRLRSQHRLDGARARACGRSRSRRHASPPRASEVIRDQA